MNIKITNGNNSITLNFISSEDGGNNFLDAVKNCLNGKATYIEYQDKKDFVIFTAEWLKNSLIVVPNENN